MEKETNFLDFIFEIWNLQILMIDQNAITIKTLFIGLTFFIIGVLISKYISSKTFKVLDRKFKVERNANHIFKSLTFYFFAFISLLFSMKMAHLPLTIFTVLGGAFAIGFGLGSQNLVNNFMSGLILMIERPVKIGDFVEIDNIFVVIKFFKPFALRSHFKFHPIITQSLVSTLITPGFEFITP